MHKDIPLIAPSLLELSACVVARDDGLHLESKEEQQCEFISYPSSSEYSELNANFSQIQTTLEQSMDVDEISASNANASANIRLPVACAEQVFNTLTAKYRRTVEPDIADEEPPEVNQAAMKVHRALRSFHRGTFFPLSNIDLSGLRLDNLTLAGILIAQHRTMINLNLACVKGVTASGVCALLAESSIQFDKLRCLKFTSTDLLRVPKVCTTLVISVDKPHRSLLPGPMLSKRKFPRVPKISIDFDMIDMHVEESSSMDSGTEISTMSSGLDMDQDDADIDFLSRSRKKEVKAQSCRREVPQFMAFCPAVEHLYFLEGLRYNIEDETPDIFLRRVLDAQRHALRTLDLSDWQNLHSFLGALAPLRQLTTLILYDVQSLENSISDISEMKTLVKLDLSQSERSTGFYARPVTALHSLVINLQNLRYLDISGTNLVAACSEDDRPFRGTGTIPSDIAGLSHLKKPLQYLGIFNCDNAPHFQNIPAIKICGDNGEDQILLALETYMNRLKMMQSVLNESYQLYRFTANLSRHVEALHLVLRALLLHQSHTTLQIAGSASLFYIIRNVSMNRNTKRSVIEALVTGMEHHIDEQVLVRNCCLSLCQFEIPLDILFNYGRVANLLVRILEMHHADGLTQRIVVFLLNSMVCHVEGDQKIEVGAMGAVEVILEQIRRKHSGSICDDVMEIGWSFLWNITDESPSNCERFLKSNGLDLFQKCYSQFPNETELVRNMMGLIGNIAEVEYLRRDLMDGNYIHIFVRLLSHLTDGIEISYNSAGVLAHLVSDGEQIWSKRLKISREEVMQEIVKATNLWELTAKRFINYRSFKPILKLLPMYDSSGSQHWAVWALANLTSTDPNKYCRYVQDEGGEPLLTELAHNPRTLERVRELAQLVLKNISNWRFNVSNDAKRLLEPLLGSIHDNNASDNDMEMVD